MSSEVATTADLALTLCAMAALEEGSVEGPAPAVRWRRILPWPGDDRARVQCEVRFEWQRSDPALDLPALGSDERLARVRDAMAEHPERHLTLAEAAEIASLSPNYFSVYFHERTGVTFGQWQREIHVERAKRLLADRRCTIDEVARSSGFGSLRTLERAFKRVTGSTPRGYRAACRRRG